MPVDTWHDQDNTKLVKASPEAQANNSGPPLPPLPCGGDTTGGSNKKRSQERASNTSLARTHAPSEHPSVQPYIVSRGARELLRRPDREEAMMLQQTGRRRTALRHQWNSYLQRMHLK